MINHARTLLMNVNGSAPLNNYLAEEIVDPEFKALTLPTPLNQVRRVLFGTNPDRHMRNYRCRQLLALAHATPLDEYLTGFDARLTYDFKSDTLILPDVWVPSVANVNDRGTLTVLGVPEPPDATGRVYHALSVTTASSGVATVERMTTPFQKVDFEFSGSDKIPLSGTGLSFRLGSEAGGQAFHVEVRSRPQKDLGQLARDASALGEPVYNYLFGLTNDEPYKTFRELWFRKEELPLRLAALVCAIVFRTEEVRRG